VFNGFNKLFTFVPNEGYHAATVTIDGESTFTNISSYEFINVRANHTIAVTFALNTYPLNIAIIGNGSVQKTPDQETYVHGSYVHLTATPNTDWEFTDWSGHASGAGNEIIIEMDGEKNVYATFSDLTLIRTLRADTKLGAKPISLKFKNNVLVAPPNWGTVLEALFDKIGKNGKTFLGIEQTDPQRMKTYAWVFYKKASELQKLYTFTHTGQAYPLDTLRKGTKYKKLSKALKPDKSYNNMFLEQAMGFKINLIASEYQILPKGLGDLIVDTTISLAGRPLKDSTLKYVGSLLDSVMTYWQEYEITDISDYIALGTFAEKFLRRVNEEFSDELVDSNYYIDTNAVVKGKKMYAIKLRGTKRVCEVCIVKKASNKNYEHSQENIANAPKEFSLEQNYPNPFNPTTIIGFSLLTAGNVTLKVFDVLGQKITTLIDNETMQAGRHTVNFNGETLPGTFLPSGVYFYQLNVDGKFSTTKKLVLMK
jgi:hypothetical protein